MHVSDTYPISQEILTSASLVIFFHRYFSPLIQDDGSKLSVTGKGISTCEVDPVFCQKFKSNRKAMNRNWGNLKANPALKTKAGNTSK